MSNKRHLKAFVRYDGTGKVVPGSVILSRTMPKVGTWVEINAYECCTPTTTLAPCTTNISATPETLTILNVRVNILCDGEIVSSGGGLYNSMDMTTLLNCLNDDEGCSQYGVYTDAGEGSVNLCVYDSVVAELCPEGTITYEIVADIQ